MDITELARVRASFRALGLYAQPVLRRKDQDSVCVLIELVDAVGRTLRYVRTSRN